MLLPAISMKDLIKENIAIADLSKLGLRPGELNSLRTSATEVQRVALEQHTVKQLLQGAL